MLTDKDRSWLRGRLERRAKDARQAQADMLRIWLNAYPDAQYLADVHAEAASVYERALTALNTESAEP